MAQDIRDLFKDDKITFEKMPENHQERFLEKLDETLPKNKVINFSWINIAAGIAVILGLSFGAFKFFKISDEDHPKQNIANTEIAKTKTLGDISPGLKKVEDYYLASINLELSKMTYTPETKDLFDGYLVQLNELDKEYERLSEELTDSGVSELTVNALIDNLKLRLNLLYRLRTQLKEFSTDSISKETVHQSI